MIYIQSSASSQVFNTQGESDAWCILWPYGRRILSLPSSACEVAFVLLGIYRLEAAGKHLFQQLDWKNSDILQLELETLLNGPKATDIKHKLDVQQSKIPLTLV